MSSDRRKSEWVGVRMTPRARRLAETAAEREGVSLSSFVHRSAQRAARKTLAARDEPGAAEKRDD